MSQPQSIKDNTIRHLTPALLFTLVTVVLFGIVYPVAMTLISELVLPSQANGSIVYVSGKPVGSAIIGQLWKKPQYFHGRPSAAGTGYDPTSTGATNLGPTSKKLVDTTRLAIEALQKDNPDAAGPVPMDLVTTSASGIDPDISPEGAYYQVPRVAKARHMTVEAVHAIVASRVVPRTLGFMGEPHVNVLQLNLILDGTK
ncbi:MAG TPA: potassium-transporting ATPase subunit KdpC [Candidatus Eremiobacteraceae bacterium]|nr:potassium-transporting ATPase subunit KdpC [Candidatus Eremiobacteraceae bacterium]